MFSQQEEELIAQCSQAIRGYELQYGTRAVAFHATIDTIHLLCGLIFKVPCYVCITPRGKQAIKTAAEREQRLHAEQSPTIPAQEAVVSQFKLAILPTHADKDHALNTRPNVLESLLTDRETYRVVARYLDDWYESKQAVGSENTAIANRCVGVRARALTKILERRVDAILAPLQLNRFLSWSDPSRPEESVERVWVVMKINENRPFTDPESGFSYEFNYRLRLLPSRRQLEKVAELQFAGNRIETENLLSAESGDSVVSAFDSSAESGFLTTRFMSSYQESDLRGRTHASKDNKRKAALAKVYDRFLDGDWDVFELFIPIHCTGVPFLVLRCQLRYVDRFRALHVYTDVVPALASQLRQLVHEAMADDLDQKLRNALSTDLQEIVDSVQTAIPVISWRIDRKHGAVIESDQPKYWSKNFIRRDPQGNTVKADIDEVLARFGILEHDRNIPQYITNAKKLALDSVKARLNRTHYSVGDGTTSVLRTNLRIANGILAGAPNTGNRREILYSALLLRLLQECYRDGYGRICPVIATQPRYSVDLKLMRICRIRSIKGFLRLQSGQNGWTSKPCLSDA